MTTRSTAYPSSWAGSLARRFSQPLLAVVSCLFVTPNTRAVGVGWDLTTCFPRKPRIRKRRIHLHSHSNWRWHLDEVFVRINGETHYLWRAVDHEGEVLEVFATKRRDRRAALTFLKRAMKRYGRSASIVTDRLQSYGAAMKVIGNVANQECGRWLNNRAENSHQPFRRRERAMAKFRDMKTLQKFAAAHASIHNHFNHDRHLNSRNTFKQNRAAALAEWRQLAA
ncbi:MAG: DDE-type integrase/transposase/recombinase [Methyloceanibacter sp.]